MKKIVTIVGARPQFIKAAMVSRELRKSRSLEEILVHTGQHHDERMSDVFFAEMEIPKPKYFLGIHGLGHGAMTGAMLAKIEEVLIAEKPAMVLVYGDTNSTLAGALAARKLGIPVCHVEAGPRNDDLSIPEEVNRIITDRISDVLICSTPVAVENLRAEGFERFACRIHTAGDLMADAFFHHSKKAFAESRLEPGPAFALCTIHRASNTEPEALRRIVEALNRIAEKRRIFFPVHPRTSAAIERNGLKLSGNIDVSPPLGYHDMLRRLLACEFVITDSGGLQREAYLARKTSVLLMDYTPWEELVECGSTFLSDGGAESIVRAAEAAAAARPSFDVPFYGAGDAAQTIVRVIEGEIAARADSRKEPK